MRKIRLILLLLICAITLPAQNADTANRLFTDGDYAAAMKVYETLLKSNPRSALYAYRYARCAQESGDYPTAIEYFHRAGDRYPLKYFYLGEIYMHTWHSEEAIQAYNQYLQSLSTPNERVPYVQKQIQYAEKRQRYLKRVEKVQIVDSMDVRIDSMVYACVLSAEAGTLTIDPEIGTAYMNQRGDRRLWSAKRDSMRVLVSAHRLLDQWSRPDTLPEIVNMADQQISPYVLSDGVTLYFASNDTNGLGGYDIYVSRYNAATETYTHPENIGYPYNSEANEYMMVIDETHHIGYFATDRFSPTGYVRIYSFIPNEQKTYWRGLSQDSIAAYAQLRYVLPADTHSLPPVVSAPAAVEKTDEPEILFVLNDSTVYTSPNDFHSQAARDTFAKWQALQQQIQSNGARLDSLRHQYSTATPAKRKEITPVILHLESLQEAAQKQANRLLHAIREEEIQHAAE